MSDPYIGEIRMTGFNFAPQGWALCNGQLLAISQNQALFAILGTTYGGNGQTTFALPDLQGRVPVHVGAGFNLGQVAGETAHTLIQPELPGHTHNVMASTAATHASDPTGRAFGNVQPGDLNLFRVQDNSATMDGPTVGPAGGSQPHENMQPYTVVNFVIALEGIFPPHN
ncbi:phage tail protein [Pseudoduganella sp. RAF53_2]|uniref:phage tail protein n=1 Tax=unclassified Pseudoduganella TaxID=2637179 RepID=UPI003F9BB934